MYIISVCRVTSIAVICSEPLVGAHHVVTVGADMVDILQSINAEGDQTATPGVSGWVIEEGEGGREEGGRWRSVLYSES